MASTGPRSFQTARPERHRGDARCALPARPLADLVGTALAAAWQTAVYAVAGLTVALLIGIPLGVIASGTLARSRAGMVTQVGVARGILAFFRAIHELVWALLFVAAIGLSPMAAVLALGIPYGGILGRIYSELLQDVPQAPLDALRRSGASEWRVFLFGRLPMALPDMVSYTFYRLECGIRSAAGARLGGPRGAGLPGPDRARGPRLLPCLDVPLDPGWHGRARGPLEFPGAAEARAMSSTPPAAYTTERTQPGLTFVSGSVLAMVVLILISWTYLIFGQSWPSHGFFSGETASRASSVPRRPRGRGRETTPAYLEGEAWPRLGDWRCPRSP